jgi:fatty-acyl-CoA synthase
VNGEGDVGSWLAFRARLDPWREAILDVATGRRLTYRVLAARAAAAARWLAASRIGLGDRVALLAKNRVEHVDLLFACAQSGSTLVPLNWRLARDELAYILSHSEPRLVLVEPGLAGLLPAAWAAGAIVLTGDPPWLADAGGGEAPVAPAPAPAPAAVRDPDRPLLLLYTSGTTGRPKGAMITARQVHWNAVNTAVSWELSSADSTITHTPFFHTGGWNVLTLPLLHLGGRVALSPAFDPREALALVAREKLTLLFAVPTMFQLMRESDLFPDVDLRSLRFAISGGAPCPPELARAFVERGVRFKQGYGLTEVGPNCFVISVADAAARPESVGFPVANERIRVVSPEGRDVRPGEVGELLIAGPHVFGGYWRDPEATALALRDGWFSTGDLVLQDADGHVSIVGRKKEMFISGGENVYPTEVERVLATHPAVACAAVVGFPDPKWGEVGRAFVVLKGEPRTSTDELREHCGRHLARYKVPKRFDVVDSLPLTPSSKVARQALRERPV